MGTTRGNEVLFQLDADFSAADVNVEPSFTSPEALVEQLGLGGDEQDQKTLWDRLVGTDTPDMATLRAVTRVFKGAQHLIELTNAYAANPAQERLAVMLGRVVTHQVRREAAVLCPDAAGLAAASTREDIVPASTRTAAIEAAGGESAEALVAQMLPAAAVQEMLEQANLTDADLAAE